MTSNYAWWERHGPRLPSHGIKAHSRRGAFGKTWWAGRWIAALEQLVNPARLARGRTYARQGQVDGGARPGTTTEESAELKRLKTSWAPPLPRSRAVGEGSMAARINH